MIASDRVAVSLPDSDESSLPESDEAPSLPEDELPPSGSPLDSEDDDELGSLDGPGSVDSLLESSELGAVELDSAASSPSPSSPQASASCEVMISAAMRPRGKVRDANILNDLALRLVAREACGRSPVRCTRT